MASKHTYDFVLSILLREDGVPIAKRVVNFKGVVNCPNLQDKVPQKAIVPVGRPRPYSKIILKMRFIPKASLRASSKKSQQVNIYLCDIYELIIQSTLLLPLLGRWLANKLTVLLPGFGNCLTPKACIDTQ